ncbi:transporter [Metarhizium anisopliae BRIP 53284]|nr:transporter [Metarhizium anisopliae BRIP 53284]
MASVSQDNDIETTRPPQTSHIPLKEVRPVPSEPGDPFLVTFDSDHSHKNPLNWRNGKKWLILDVLSTAGFNRTMVSTIMAPALATIAQEFGMNSAAAAMVMSIYPLATAIGPLFMGPLSELYGRKPILHASNIWFLGWNIACGFANSAGLLIAARFLAGLGASAIYALASGVLSDLWRADQRGKSLGAYLLIPLLGAAVGPIVGGFISSRSDWRWSFWATSAFQGIMTAVSFAIYEESYGPVILRRQARRVRRATGDDRYYAAIETHETRKLGFTTVRRALSRPFRLLATHPIVQITSIISSFEYGLLYLVLSTFGQLWVDQYGQSVEISGLHYLACAIGEVAGSQLGGPLMDYYYRKAVSKNGGAEPKPEHRLPFMFGGLSLVPVGLCLYGWGAQYRLSWVIVDLGIVITSFGSQIAGLPLHAYLIDVYGEHTSSAISASQLPRSLAAFLFPLFAPKMYSALGYGWGNTVLAAAALCISLPSPWILWKYGEKFRSHLRETY